MKIIDVLDNRAKDGLSSENGLSLYIKCDAGEFLFDTGASEKVRENLKTLNIDIAKLEHIVISHNHNDHTGGLKWIIDSAEKANIYISKNYKGEFLKVMEDREYILSDNTLDEAHPEKFQIVDDQSEILNNVYLCHVKNPNKEFICSDKHLFERVYGNLLHDSFRHEMYGVVIEGDRLNIITACTHNGIINVLEDALERFPNKHISTITGGLHIKDYNSDSEIQELGERIADYKISALYSCHCTGEHAENILGGHGFPLIKMRAGAEIDTCKTFDF